MIPWVREKFAERRAKWLAARNKRTNANKTNCEIAIDNENAADVSRCALQPVIISDRNAIGICTNVEYLMPQHETDLQTSFKFKVVALAGKRIMQKLRKLFIKKNGRRSCCSTPSHSGESSEEKLNITQSEQVQQERITVRVICPSARILVLHLAETKTLLEIKNEVLLELADDPSALPLFATDVRQLTPRYRLYRADFDGSELSDTHTLKELSITNLDTLVLAQRRNLLQKLMPLERDIQPPRQAEIDFATRDITIDTQHLPLVDINEIFQQSNLQFDVRKVLISLAQVSARIIAAGPYARRLIEMLRQKLINKRDFQNDTMQCLVEMGFKKEDAEYALRLHNNIYSQTLEWLIAHQNEAKEQNNTVTSNAGLQKSQSLLSPSAIMSNDSIIENAEALLEIVRIYSHRDIPPSADSIAALKDMGFEEAEIIDALKKTCNNKAAACEWLCGNRSDSLVELREGLATDSPILKTILEMPQVQMNLSNPKVLIAFLAILENENTIRVWGGDNDTTSVITHILQKYHEEKHVMGLNQFYSDRT